MWFPKPPALIDVLLVRTGGVANNGQLFDLLYDPGALEWRDKVGVAGPVDGSAKTTTRLIVSGGWVLKTSIADAHRSKSELFDRVRKIAETGTEARFWHPDKSWGVFFYEGSWYPINATPLLNTLRGLSDPRKKMQAWTHMMEFAVGIALRTGLGLDLNPSNFGTAADSDRIYYLDDEWYSKLTFTELSSAIVARIPEEPEISTKEWAAWGRVLAAIIGPLCRTREDSENLFDNVAAHPVVSQFEGKRSALLKGLRQRVSTRNDSMGKPKGLKGQRGRTAVIADVHGNSDALDAVLSECKDFGVDSYIFVGDAVGYGPDPKECIQRLAELPNARYVRGNHDHAIGSGVLRDGMSRVAQSCAYWTLNQLSVEDREWLISLPVDIHGAGWLAVHGAPRDPRRFLAYVYELTYEENLEFLSEHELQLCFYGHTHVQFIHEKTPKGTCRKRGTPPCTRLDDGQVFLVNPGSVGQPRDKDTRAAYALWDQRQNSVSLHRVAYNISSVVEKIRKLNLPTSLGERLMQGV